MRIIAGAFRGRRLHTPKGEKIRPTIDRVREAIFNILAADVPGSRVLDLFSGTGALGIEALSRGAERAVFVDQAAASVRLVRKNLTLCGALDRSEILQESVPAALKRLAARNEPFHLVFMDPPYGKGYVQQTLTGLDAVTTGDARVIAEHHSRDATPAELGPWIKESERRYGDTLVSFYSRKI